MYGSGVRAATCVYECGGSCICTQYKCVCTQTYSTYDDKRNNN